MANYVVKEMPEGMNSSNGKAFPKMQVYTEFDYDKVVELVNTYSPAFSKGVVRGVLDTLTVVMKMLPFLHCFLACSLWRWSLLTVYLILLIQRQKRPRQNTYT